MEYRLLGPLEVLADGRWLEIGSARQQVVLAMLLLAANKTVSLDRLATAIWDDHPPVTAKSQVQTCISALRRLLASAGEDQVIGTRPAGYAIRVPDDSLDVAAFERLVGSARAAAEIGSPAEAARELRAALGLWRGPAAAGVRSRLVEAAATRLDEERLGALEACIDLELGLGRHHELVGELSELVSAHPLRERFRAQHVLALYRSARQADALDSYMQARRIFIDELGLEPGPELTELHRAILANEPALVGDRRAHPGPEPGPASFGPAMVPRQLPAAIADFTGRNALLRELAELLSGDAGDASGPPVVSLTGKAGVGKSALALHAAHAVQGSYPDGQLFAQLQLGNGQPVEAADVLARFLRALGLPVAATIGEDVADRAATYRTRLGDKSVLIVLDDAADVDHVLPLIPGSARCAVIVTSRHPLLGLHGARQFQVDDLDEDASVELLGRVIGYGRVQAEQAAAVRLVRLCGCLPLALRIVAAKLHARPHWQVSHMVRRIADEGRRLDELALSGAGIRAALSLSCNSLGAATRQLFARLALLGATTFAGWVAAPLMDLNPQEAEELLDTLVEAHLVQVRDQDGGARFQLHELVRIYAAERLTAEEQLAARAAALERLLGCWLSLAEEAHRRSYGGDFALLHGAAARWRLPAGVVDQLLARPTAWFRSERAGLVSAVLVAAQAGLDELCWDLAMTSVTLFESDHEVDEWRRTHEAALAVARRNGNRRGEAAILYSLGSLSASQRPARAAAQLEPALRIFAELGDVHGRALALAAIAFVEELTGHHEQALARYRESLDGLRQVGDLVGEADALVNIAQIRLNSGQVDAVLEPLDRAAAICRTLRAPRMLAQTEYRRGGFFLRVNDLDRAEQSFGLALDVTEREGDLVGKAYALSGLGMVRIRQERYKLAEASLGEAHRISDRLGDSLARGQVLLACAELCLATGQSEQAAALLDEIRLPFGEAEPDALWRARYAELRVRAGQVAAPS